MSEQRKSWSDSTVDEIEAIFERARNADTYGEHLRAAEELAALQPLRATLSTHLPALAQAHAEIAQAIALKDIDLSVRELALRPKL